MIFFKKKQTVLLTGAAKGIGWATAQNLASQGFDLILLDKNKGLWQKQANDLAKVYKIKIQTFVLDITQATQVKRLATRLKKQKIDVLINNAGVITPNNFLDQQSDKEIRLMLEVNLWGMILVTKYFLPALKASKGLLINIASGAGIKASAKFAVYCASKFGVVGFSQAMAKELAKVVKVLIITPGATNTSLFKKGFGAKRQALYQPQDIAQIISDSIKEQKKYNTGAIVDKCRHLEP